MQFNESGKPALPASTNRDLTKYLRVKLTAGILAVAGATDRDLGVLLKDEHVDQSLSTVHMHNVPGTIIAIASKAIAKGATVYTAASGKVSDTQATGAFIRGVALTAATADGDHIEITNELGEVAGA